MFIGFNLPQAVGDLALFLEVLGPGVKMQALHRCPNILAEHRIAVHVQCHWHPLPHLPLHDWPMLAQPQLPDDARRLAFVPMQSAEPFRSGRELWEGQ